MRRRTKALAIPSTPATSGTPGAERRAWRDKLRRAAIALLGLGLLAGAAWGGWALHDATADEPQILVKRTITVASEAAVTDGVAPSVVGLDALAARQALIDAGVPDSKVRTREIAYAGPAGLVVAQRPAPAARTSATTDATIDVSRPAVMPDLNGRPEDAARAALTKLGAIVTVRTRFTESAEEGDVVQTRPAAGEPLVEEAIIVTAAPESSAFLPDLRFVGTACAPGEVTTGGNEASAMVCGATSTLRGIVFKVDGGASRLTATVAMPDGAGKGSRATYRVIADGRTVASGTVTADAPAKLAVSVAGTRNVRIATMARDSEASVAFVDGTLFGSRATLDRLAITDPP